MTVSLSSLAGAGSQFFDNNGTPLAGGKIYTYAAGTTTPQTTYTSSSGSTPHSNPIILDSVGRVPGGEIWLTSDAAYKFVLETPVGTLLGTYDDIYAIGNAAGLSSLIGANGSALVGFTQSGAGAVLRTQQAKDRDTISITDFGASSSASASTNTAAIAAALVECNVRGAALYVPGVPTSYQVNDEFTVPDGVTVYGDGYGSCIEQTVQGKNVFISGDGCKFFGLRIKMCAGNNLNIAKQNCIYAANIQNITVENNWLQLVDINSGVMLSGVKNALIDGNIVFGATWPALAGPAASAADILLYSSLPGGRIVITNNFCFSNNSQGIYADALGTDSELIISANVCITLDPATCTLGGAWSEIANGGIRRHGIVIGYTASSVGGHRAIISNNVCRNTRWTGIYRPGNSPSAVLVEGNFCSNNGYDTSNSLSGGIYATLSGLEVIQNNYILDFKNTGAGTGGITLNANSAPTNRAKVSGNRVEGSLNVGIAIGTNAALIDITDNQLTSNAGTDISWGPNAGQTSVGGLNIENNSIFRTSGTNVPGIRLDFQSSTLYTLVRNNVIRGFDNTTATTTNAAIAVTVATPKYAQILDNKIANFYYGIYYAAYFAVDRHIDVLIERNLMQDCNTGIVCAGIAANVTVPLVDNRFVSVTTPTTGAPLGSTAGRICTRLGQNLITQTTASPTLGTWAVGDRSANSAPANGIPKGWLCTVAGAPGTWLSEGNL